MNECDIKETDEEKEILIQGHPAAAWGERSMC